VEQRLVSDGTSAAEEDPQSRLWCWARGYLPYMAAVQLLCSSPVSRSIFGVLTAADSSGQIWLDLEHGLCRVNSSGLSGGQRRVALLVLELAEVNTGAPLGELICGIDDANIAALLNAVAVAAEWGTRGVASKVTGEYGE